MAPRMELIRYDAARKALAAAVRVDEVKSIRDKAVALGAYAKEARDTELIDHATEIRLRAERRAGEILVVMAKSGERAKRGEAKKKTKATFKLGDLGVTKHQSQRWQRIAAVPEREFERNVTKAKALAVASVEGAKEVIKQARAERQVEKKKRRATRERELGAKIKALPEGKRFGVIVADPEWEFEPWSKDTGMDRAAANHYPTSALKVIEERDVGSIAADDCVLFLWATIPMLPHALVVMGAWGFDYKSHQAYVKTAEGDLRVLSPGTGYWFRECHELLLVGTRGKVPAPNQGEQEDSVFFAPRGDQHSAKPESVLAWIEEHFPTVPKIELNRRGPAREGWDAWGNEAES